MSVRVAQLVALLVAVGCVLGGGAVTPAQALVADQVSAPSASEPPATSHKPDGRAPDALRALLTEILRGVPNYRNMNAPSASGIRASLSVTRDKLRRLGPITSIAYKGPGPWGTDTFDVQFLHGSADWHVTLNAGGRIDVLGWQWVSEPQIPKEPLSNLLKNLRRELDQAAAANEFSGSVLVAKNGRVLFQRVYGFKDRERSVRNTSRTRFDVASMDKMFTAVAIMQLAQSGRLKLDAPISAYLPDYPNKAVAEQVTIHQLLTHTGATRDFYGQKFSAMRDELVEPADYIKALGDRPLAFEPGSKFSYSNFGYIILGRIIEVVSGQSYDAYVQEHIFHPARMTDTGAIPDGGPEGQAVGYTLGESGLTPATGIKPVRGNPATNGYSTAVDLARFAEALMSYRLLDRAHTNLLLSPKVAAGNASYAYGFESSDRQGFVVVGHSGNHPGANGDLRIVPSANLVIVSLANLDAPAATRFSDYVIERLNPAEVGSR